MRSWNEFISGKRNKADVAAFLLHFSPNIFRTHLLLKRGVYRHGGYSAFKINDPKPRNIHKASVLDRLVHHAIYRVLYPYFDRKFIFDSYSCRVNKGTHRALERFKYFGKRVSRNNTRTCWVLKCDIRKFFASIDHAILKEVLVKFELDKNTQGLLRNIIDSFYTEGKSGKGLPLGNLTSQLLVNIYMNEFDQHMKHALKVKCYIRYADDFVVLSENKPYLENLLPQISNFLMCKLKLDLHPDKVFIKTLASGVDFLGWVHFPGHRVLRTVSKQRMIRKLNSTAKPETASSYRGLLKHGATFKLRKRIGLDPGSSPG